jgi:hypothetical protein
MTWFIRYRKWTYISCPNTTSTTMYRELFLTQKRVLGHGLHHLLASKLCLLCVVQICIDTCLHCTVGGIIGHYAAKQLWVGSAFSWTHCIVQNILWRRYLSQTIWQYWARVSGSPAVTCFITVLIPIEEIYMYTTLLIEMSKRLLSWVSVFIPACYLLTTDIFSCYFVQGCHCICKWNTLNFVLLT